MGPPNHILDKDLLRDFYWYHLESRAPGASGSRTAIAVVLPFGCGVCRLVPIVLLS